MFVSLLDNHSDALMGGCTCWARRCFSNLRVRLNTAAVFDCVCVCVLGGVLAFYPTNHPVL